MKRGDRVVRSFAAESSAGVRKRWYRAGRSLLPVTAATIMSDATSCSGRLGGFPQDQQLEDGDSLSLL